MILLARVFLISALLGMSGIMAVYHMTEPANLLWLNGAR